MGDGVDREIGGRGRMVGDGKFRGALGMEGEVFTEIMCSKPRL